MPLTTTYVDNWVRKRLGGSIVPVELGVDDISGTGPDPAAGSALEEALRVYSRWSPQVKYDQLLLSAGTRVYPIPANKRGRGLLTVAIPPSKYRFGLGWGFGDEFSVFDSSVVQDLGHYHIAISYYKQARRVLSANFQWKYILERGELEITPTPQEPLVAYYTFVDNVALAEVPSRNEDWVLAYTLAEAKGMLGEARELLGSVQGNQTTIQLNGTTLKEKAAEEKEKLTQELRDRVGDRFCLPLRDS